MRRDVVDALPPFLSARLTEAPTASRAEIRKTERIEIADALGPSMALVERVFAFYDNLARKPKPREECLRLVGGRGPSEVQKLLAQLQPAWADHAIASVYARLMPARRRKRLGVYFTPPHLVAHLIRRMREVGLDTGLHHLRDPSAGGAAFLVPLAREMVGSWKAERVRRATIIKRLRDRLWGKEIDRGLASVANALVRRMLVSEFGFSPRDVSSLSLVRVGDSLRQPDRRQSDHEIGNPPYLRLDAAQQRAWRARFADIADGRLNLYAMFVRRAVNEARIGGLVGHIVPASFLGGPEFRTFRQRISELAEILVLDVVQKRRDVFLDVTQDACFIILRRRAVPDKSASASTAASGVLKPDGTFVPIGRALLPTDGAPWSLPGAKANAANRASLANYGYRGTVGYLVANRQGERLHSRPAKGRVPLVWAKCVKPDGSFDFDRGRKSEKANGLAFVEVPEGASYVIRTACVAVQRTSSSSQPRRLVAAAVPRSFVQRHGGIVGENHVILLVPMRRTAVSPTKLAAVLNGREASAALARISGSASISVRVLEGIPLPPRDRARAKSKKRR
jgi:adenine-specific DNA-methyltransferase